jgi:IS4 transposase
MFHDLFYETVEVCKMAAPKNHKFQFRNKLLSLDASTITLCLAIFPWAEFRRTKGAVKLRLLIKFGASPISAIYKDRWQIDLFLKAMK